MSLNILSIIARFILSLNKRCLLSNEYTIKNIESEKEMYLRGHFR